MVAAYHEFPKEGCIGVWSSGLPLPLICLSCLRWSMVTAGRALLLANTGVYRLDVLALLLPLPVQRRRLKF